MLISTRWLSRHVDLTGVDLQELANRFTLNVAELEGVHEVGTGLDGVVVGHVLEVHPIEGARVQRTVVDTGPHGRRQIVCGAPNVAAGQYVPVVLPGHKIGDLEIREAEVRGVLSSGMIASEKELGLSEEHEGIMVLDGTPEPGAPLAQAVDVHDVLFEIDNKSLTHRPDCWGHRGVAREVAAILGRELKPLDLEVAFTSDRPLAITVEDQKACPRYTAVTLDGVTVRRSPLWMRLLLGRVGTRAINNVVDATNFVMLDLGNPLHAFDGRQIGGGQIVVRRARPGESFVTLDGQRRALEPRDLLIADAERGVALAGIMGGLDSEIQDDTTSVVLESANFDAGVVRATAQRLGLRTESSARFEKSLDPRLSEDASRAFCRLLQQLDANVRVTSALMDVAAPLPEPPVIELRVQRVEARLGVKLGEERIADYLRRLTFGVEQVGEGVLRVAVPSFRATKDIAIEADLIEEVGRSFGYDHITPAPPTIQLARPHPNAHKRFERAARAYLTLTGGFDEVVTYSFAFDPLLERLGARPERRIEVANPISAEMPALRTDLGPNLLGVLEKNAREVDSIRVFELERVFRCPADPAGLPVQPVTLGGLVAETRAPEGADLFFALKGYVLGLSRAVERAPLRLVQGGVGHPWAHPVRQARLFAGEREVGYMAEAHPLTLHQLDVGHRAALFEIDLDAWRDTPVAAPGYKPLPRFPAVFRDFAVVVPGDAPAEVVREAIISAAPELVRDVVFQSVYRGQGVPEGHKSMAWSVTLRRDDRTLTEPEVRATEEAIWRALTERVGGRPRS